MTEEQRKSSGYTDEQIQAMVKSKEIIDSQASANKQLSDTVNILNQNFTSLNQLSQQILTSSTMGGMLGGGMIGGGGLLGGGGPNAATGTEGNAGPVRAEAYGPSQGEFTHSTNYGPTGAHLQAGDYAVSPDMASGHQIGQMFQFTDASGKTISGRFADFSYKTAGQPNTRTIEQWNGRDLGHVSALRWMAEGGLVRSPTLVGAGEKGPEMILPLSSNLMSKMGHTVNLSFGNVSFGAGAESRSGEAFIHEFAETIANEVKRVLETENRRSAVV
jgi:hypothetical protein